LGLPRGGCKAGIWGDPAIAGAERQRTMQAFGRILAPYLVTRSALVGPDMGVGVEDLVEIYKAAGAAYPRSGLFNQLVEGQPLEFHITGHGVIMAARVACELAGRDFAGAAVAIEGFGHVGVGAARYALRGRGKLVAVSTVEGALYNERGIDFERLLELRGRHGDRCVLEYGQGEHIARGEIYFLPVDLLVPGARPYVINEANAGKVQAKVIASGGNIPITDAAERQLFARGILSVPDFIANSGGVIASWVDYLGGNVEQAFRANEALIGATTREVLSEAMARSIDPRAIATGKVARRLAAARGTPRKSYEETREEIRTRLGVFG
ncbi:MAG TPA: hypothetical protein VJ487_01790, partial [Alphaproteobacteria bacterium]|nr:hypothetical protein [Alphaproteobacteria bacterium]